MCRSVLAPALALAIMLALAPALARAGTYGSEERAYPGFIARIDCSVGSMGDGSGEGEIYRRKREAARAKLEAVDPQVQRMYRHFSTGKHPFASSRTLLDSEKTDASAPWERAVRVDVEDVQLLILVKQQPDEAQRAKIAVEFVASQLWPGGALDTSGEGVPLGPRDLADFEQRLGWFISLPGSIPTNLYHVLHDARQHEASLRLIAQQKTPFTTPDHSTDNAAAGWFTAQILVSLFDRTHFPRWEVKPRWDRKLSKEATDGVLRLRQLLNVP
jgi:hypothetical protein